MGPWEASGGVGVRGGRTHEGMRAVLGAIRKAEPGVGRLILGERWE